MGKRQYGIAVIGAGDRGTVYSNAWSKFENARLIAICDIIPERAVKLKEKYGYAAIYTEYKNAIDRDDVDIVTVCVPTYFHPEMSIYAMKKGKHVISEKAMALSLQEATDMINSACENNVKLAIGLQYRYISQFKKIKKVIEEDIIGRPVLMHFSDVREIRPKITMHDAKCGNGGPLVDMCCHYYDLMRWFFKSDPDMVMSSNFTFAKDRIELTSISHKAPDTASIIVKYKSGDMGNIAITWGLPPKVNGSSICEAFGPKGLLKVEKDGVKVVLEGGVEKEILLEEDIPGSEEMLISEFIDAIENNREPETGGIEGQVALATSLASLKSAAENRPVKISEIFKENPCVLNYIEQEVV